MRRAAHFPTEPNTNPAAAPAKPALVEYVGSSSLSIIGTVTGKRYRFERTGSKQLVDVRDAAALDSIPWLRRAVEHVPDRA
ncbi:hypothetical protein ACV229_21460 [Burkholderia sp. MR1-5-21]